jgi:thioredoxin reductase (NADPH)
MNSAKRENQRRVVIIGSGPAGLTAAIYASRASLKPLVIEGMSAGGPAGGQLMITSDVENYPGFPEAVTGPGLIEMFRKQAERFGTDFLLDDVASVDLSKRPFTLKTTEEEIAADTLIVATGATAKYLGLPGEKEFYNKGLSACATCDGAFFKGKHVAVIGGGDTAMEEAQYLTRMCSKVSVIHRRDSLRASKIMADRALGNPKIEFIWDTTVESYLGDEKGKVRGLLLKNLKTNESREAPFGGVFIAIGHEPNTKLFKGQLDFDEKGYLRTKSGSTYTNVPGVFACGDAQDSVYRQAVTAAGTGCMAAIDAERWLEEHDSR